MKSFNVKRQPIHHKGDDTASLFDVLQQKLEAKETLTLSLYGHDEPYEVTIHGLLSQEKGSCVTGTGCYGDDSSLVSFVLSSKPTGKGIEIEGGYLTFLSV